MKELQGIAIRRFRAIITDTKYSESRLSANTIFSQFGYLLKADSSLSFDIREVSEAMADLLKVDYNYTTLFKDFPYNNYNKDFLNKRISNHLLQLFGFTNRINSIKLSCGCDVIPGVFDLKEYGACPVCNNAVPELKEENSVFSDKPLVKAKFLSTISLAELNKKMLKLYESSVSISENDARDIETVMMHSPDFFGPALFGLNVKNKENLAHLAGLIFKYNRNAVHSIKITNPVDVIRIVAKYLNQDVSLSDKVRLSTIPNFLRQFCLRKLNNKLFVENIGDVYNYRGLFLRLGEIIHPNKYGDNFKIVKQFFHILRNEKIVPFGSVKNKLLSEKKYDELAEAFVNRKKYGEFGRNILIMLSGNSAKVFGEFAKISKFIDTNILLSIVGILKDEDKKDSRYVFPKSSNRFKMKSIPLSYDNVNFRNELLIHITNVLIKRFKLMNTNGSLFDKSMRYKISENASFKKVPLSIRNNSESLESFSRGDKLIVNENYVTATVYWHQSSRRTDLDISAKFLNNDFSVHSDLYYSDYNCAFAKHSGDMTSAENGAVESIEIDKKRAIENNVRYAIIFVNSYCGENFEECKEAFVAINASDDKGGNFDPKKSINRMNLNSPSKACIPIIVDIVDNMILHTDIYTDTRSITNIVSNSDKIIDFVKGMKYFSDIKPSMDYLLYCIFSSNLITITRKDDEKIDDIVEVGPCHFDNEKLMEILSFTE